MSANNNFFQSIFSGMLVQASVHNVDMKDENIRKFVIHLAEVQAQQYATLREMEDVVSKRSYISK